MYSLENKRIWVTGHKGMVGSAIVRHLQNKGCSVLKADRTQVDLLNQKEVDKFVANEEPDAIVIAAAKVGGILANDSFPADFLYENLMIEANLFGAAHKNDVNRVLFLGSSCIYPKMAPQPMTEDALLTGPLEPTNEWYAIAKIAGIKLAQAYRKQYDRDYISAMPTNLYGYGDNFDLNSSHVLPALIRKAHEAKISDSKELVVWGSGTPKREFLFADDCADALVFLLENYSDHDFVNVGCGEDISIADVARLVADVVGFGGELIFDKSKPDGTPRKLMSISKLSEMGWAPKTSLRDGIKKSYTWYLENSAG